MRKQIIKPIASQCIRLLNIAVKHIHEQGGGCYDRMGAAYKANGRKDVIAVLASGQSIRSNTFGVISGEEQKYIVTRIVKRHNINADRQETRGFLVKFLQQLQDAHDDAFDPFNVVDGNRMELFDTKIKSIRENLNRIVNG